VGNDLARDAEALLSDASRPETPGTPSGTLLEQWIEYTCIQAMSEDKSVTKEQVAAAKVAVSFLAVKSKLPVKWGEGFGDE
jgi:hypothetical protein